MIFITLFYTGERTSRMFTTFQEQETLRWVYLRSRTFPHDPEPKHLEGEVSFTRNYDSRSHLDTRESKRSFYLAHTWKEDPYPGIENLVTPFLFVVT